MSPVWLKAVPWSTLLANAPVIMDGAKKLVSMVRNKPVDTAPTAQANAFSGDPESALGLLHARVQFLEQEQKQTAELLRNLAETNAQMTQALEFLRARAKLNFRLALIALAGLLGTLIWLSLR